MTAAEMLYLVPTRGRPANARRLRKAWQETGADAGLLFIVDDDDPYVAEYTADSQDVGKVGVQDPARLAESLNRWAPNYAPSARYLGFMGDDHLPRTEGWDRLLAAELDRMGTGIVYGDDRIHGRNLPTAVCMTSDIVRTLGWMVPPTLVHLYADNAWKTLGERIGRLRYLPDVVIEHLHPIAGRADWDETYGAAHAGDLEAADRRAYETWVAGALSEDVMRLRRGMPLAARIVEDTFAQAVEGNR